MFKHLFIWNHIRWINFCCNIITRSKIPQTISSATNHASFGLCVLDKALWWVALATSIWQLRKLLWLRLGWHFAMIYSINGHLIFSFKYFLMQNRKEIFTPFQNILVNILGMLSWHTLVPDVYDDKNVLNTHFLKLRQQLFTTTFFVTIIISFH